MSNRLDKERELILQPKRMQYCISEIQNRGFEVFDITDTTFKFKYKEAVVNVFPYSGWHSGKSIKDGRGIKNLLRQLK